MNDNTGGSERTCSICGGALSVRNTSGICASTFACRSALQEKRRSGAENPSILLEPAYEIDEDGNQRLDEWGDPIEIVDEVTVRVLVSGVRRVSFTEHERDLAILAMIKLGYRFKEIANHLGTSTKKLKPLIEELGYELIPRRQPDGKGLRDATEIRKVAS
jgi:hypothetical protein